MSSKAGGGPDGVAKVWVLNSLLALGTVSAFLLLRHDGAHGVASFHVPLAVLTLLFFGAGICALQVEVQGNGHSVALGEIPLILGLFFASPVELLLARSIGAGGALLVYRRQSMPKAVFNLSRLCFESVVAVVVFRAIVAQGSPTDTVGWAAAFSATMAATMIGIGATVTANSLSEGARRFEQVGHALGIGMGICVANSGLGLIAAGLLWSGMPWMVLLLIVPLGMLFIVYRAYTREHQRHSGLEKSLARSGELEKRLKYQALHDPLTGLANRGLFTDRVEHALALNERSGDSLGVLFIDLDDFKKINDSLGHMAGDQMLVEAAARLGRCLRPGDTAARLGGDEFAILLENMDAPEVSVAVAQRVIGAIMAPFTIQGKSVTIRASIGIAVADGGTMSAHDIIRNADLAMYRAKEEDGGYRLFKQSMHRAALERLDLVAELQRAVDSDEFVVHYQPIVDLDSGDVDALEALVRWEHPRRGILEPSEFISLAEDTGLIVPIGRWVLEEACRRMVGWQAAHPNHAHMRISVNLSPRQFGDPDLVGNVVDILDRTQLDAECLILEITEGVLMNNGDAAAETLKALGDLGVKPAIDDFGTGFSSLRYLRRLRVDVLKIASPFVGDIGIGENDESLVKAIVQLGNTLQLRTIAEGIENRDQLWALRNLGCELGQGFYFTPAMPVERLEEYLDSGAGIAAAGAPRPDQSAVGLVQDG